ncbi:MAG TPA: nucleotidyltransferase family protein [Candidatus Dormibacteraeota bacterium]|nr:nucleotidyltransferase family protein [Candidatus Dormibacteraeota bacterium]
MPAKRLRDVLDPALAWRATRLLGHVEQSPERLSAFVDELPGAPGDGVADALVRHIAHGQVDEIALDNLRRLAPRAGVLRLLAEHLEAEADAQRDKWALILPAVRRTIEHASAAGARVMKGFDLRRHYPRPELRHHGDLDLHFPTVAAAAAFIRPLRASGWSWFTEELPWLQWDEHGVPFGQCALGRSLPRGLATGADVHIGPYVVSRDRTLPLVGFEPMTYDGVIVRGLAPETSIALIAAHAVSHGHLRMKDVNDLAMVARGRNVDWASAFGLSRAAGVDGAVRQLLHWAALEYEPLGAPAPGAGDGAGPLPVEPDGDAPAKPWRPRVVAGSAPPPGRRHRWWLVPPSALDAAALEPAPEPLSPRTVERLADELELITCGDAGAVRFAGDAFVPTASGDVPRASLALALALDRERG